VLSVGRNLDKTYTYDLEQDHQTTSLERAESIQDLGVLVDERLSFSEHMQNKINKAYAMLGVIKQNFKYLKTSSFISVTAKGTGHRTAQGHRAGVDVDVTPPTGSPVGHPPNPATLCDRSAQGSKS